MNHRVFVSYSSQNLTFAKSVAAWLEEDGFVVWADWKDVPPGAEWRPHAHSGIHRCHVFIALALPGYESSEGFTYEHALARRFKRRVLWLAEVEAPHNLAGSYYSMSVGLNELAASEQRTRICSAVASLAHGT